MKYKILSLDDLCEICGYFVSNTDVGERYGCTYQDNEENEDNSGIYHCLDFACPLANVYDVQDVIENNDDEYLIKRVKDLPPDTILDNLMILNKL